MPTVFARPRTSCSDHHCLISRPLSSFESANAREHLNSPVTDHVSRFDWRLRVPGPKPPLSTVQKVLEKRVQPPFPTDSYPYDPHIQKYKDQSVMHRVPSLPIDHSHRPPVSSLFYHPSARKMRLSSKNAFLAGVWTVSSKRAIASLTPRHIGWIFRKAGDLLLVLHSALVSFSLPTSLSEFSSSFVSHFCV